MKKVLYIPFFALLLLSCQNSQEKQGSEENNSLVIENTYDFGRVKQGDTLITIFQLRNELDKNLNIEEIFASSPQVNVFIDKKNLKSKESATINVEFLTDNLNGSQKRLISIKTDNETEPYYKYYILAVVQSLDSYRREDLFNLIKNKKETAHNLPKDLDFSSNYTEKELKALNLDPDTISANEYYFLSGQEFLKEDIEGLSFQIYYKHFYGNQLEKILRVQRPDTVFDIILSGQYSNGMDGSTLSTEFRNDFRFKESKADIQTVKDEQYSTAYYIDSLITFYKYNSRLDFTKDIDYSYRWYKEITTNPETGKRDTLLEQMSSLGTIQTTEFLTGISYVPNFGNLPETITIYSKNNNTRTKLETIETGGAYIDLIELFTLYKNHFIYIEMMETSGNSYSYFFAIDTRKMTLKKVEQDFDNYKFTDSLQVHKGYGITKEADNTFKSGGILRSENRSFYFEREHKMIKVNGQFVLKSISTEITPTDNQ